MLDKKSLLLVTNNGTMRGREAAAAEMVGCLLSSFPFQKKSKSEIPTSDTDCIGSRGR